MDRYCLCTDWLGFVSLGGACFMAGAMFAVAVMGLGQRRRQRTLSDRMSFED